MNAPQHSTQTSSKQARRTNCTSLCFIQLKVEDLFELWFFSPADSFLVLFQVCTLFGWYALLVLLLCPFCCFRHLSHSFLFEAAVFTPFWSSWCVKSRDWTDKFNQVILGWKPSAFSTKKQNKQQRLTVPSFLSRWSKETFNWDVLSRGEGLWFFS